MAKSPTTFTLRRRPVNWAFLVLALILSLTLLSALFVRHLVQLQQQARFTREVDTLTQSVAQRLDGYLDVMRATRGLWNVQESVSRDEFARYVAALNLPQQYPGLQGLGFAALLGPSGLGALQRDLRAQGAESYRVFPPGERPAYVPVTYLEPRDAANQYALGYDMFSEPKRRAAIERAVASGQVAASAPIRLVQEDLKARQQSGFLLYLPVYRAGAGTDTPAERRAAVVGVVYAPFRFGDFVGSLKVAGRYGAVSLRVQDGADVLYGQSGSRKAFADTRTLDVGGRIWTLAYRAGPQFGADTLRFVPLFIALLGGAVALTLFWGTLRQVGARERAEDLALSLAASRASLRESELRYRGVLEALPQMVWVTDPQGKHLYYNGGWYAYTGLSEEASLNYGFAEALHPDDVARTLAAWERSWKDGEPYQIEYRFRRHDGEYHWFVGRASAIRDASGAVIEWVGTCTDIDERMAFEGQLRRSEARYRGLIEGLPQIVWLSDAGGQTSYFNRRWAEYVGEAHAQGGFSPEVVYAADWARFQAAQRHSLESGAPFAQEVRLRRADGVYRTFVLRGAPIRDGAGLRGDVIEWVGAANDVEDQTYAEASSRLLADVGRLIAAPLGEARDWTGVLRAFTQRFVQSATLWLEEDGELRRLHAAQSADISELLQAHAEGARQLVGAVMASGTLQVVSPTPGLAAVGLRRMVALPLVARDEAPLGALLLGYDHAPEPRDVQLAQEVVNRMTTVLDNQRLFVQAREAERAMNELNQSLESRVQVRTRELLEANQELEAFSYSVSHDLRTPLRHIVGFGDLLRKETDGNLGDKAERYLGIITDAATRMSALIDDLLGFSRMGRQELRLAPVDLNVTVREVRGELLHEYENRQVEWRLGDLPTVQGDAGLLKLVFTNLLANALKYSRKRALSRVELSAHERGGEAIIEVRDNGVGFDSRFADKLFGVFQRLHRSEEFEGTGIGLANVRRIVGRHGGRVWAESELDGGASFFVALPLAAPSLAGRGAVSGGTS